MVSLIVIEIQKQMIEVQRESRIQKKKMFKMVFHHLPKIKVINIVHWLKFKNYGWLNILQGFLIQYN